MFVGAVPSFMPFPTPKQRSDLYWRDHEALFALIQPRLVLTYERNAAAARSTLPNLSVPIAVADERILRHDSVDPSDLPAVGSHDLACLQHSSGTTSLKKGVMLTHHAILAHVDSYAKAIGFGREDSIASWLPLYHDMGFIACFMTSIVMGTRLVAIDPFVWTLRPQVLLTAIEEYRSTFCWLPNFAFSHIATRVKADASHDLSSIRAFINCSEPCKPQTFERFAGRFFPNETDRARLQVCYAMAENVFAVTQTDLSRPATVLTCDAAAFSDGAIRQPVPGGYELSLLSCGTPIDGVRVEIRDADGSNSAPASIGEITITSPFLFDGYYKLPERTQEKLHDGWYATGDMGFLHDGELYVTGRMDDMLIVNGRNYYAHEIEAIANGVAGVAPGRTVAISVTDARTDATAVTVLLESVDGADAAHVATGVRHEVLERLGLAVHSVSVLARGSLIKTTSGKISRSKNRELFLEGKL